MLKSKNYIFNSNARKIAFPKVYDMDSLEINNEFIPVDVISINKLQILKLKNVRLKFELNIPNAIADIYLYVNGNKKDMYCLVPSGTYEFDIFPQEGENNIELFYVSNNLKSKSTVVNVASD